MDIKDSSLERSPTENIPEEKIRLRPSTEAIPDEFEHQQSSIIVHIFCRDEFKGTDSKLSKFIRVLKEAAGYNIHKNNIHKLENKDTVVQELDSISKCAEKISGLLIIFLGFYQNDGNFIVGTMTTKDVWKRFLGKEMKMIPKMFFFIAAEYMSEEQKDTTSTKEYFELPAEADILIFYIKIKGVYAVHHFLEKLSYNIEQFGRRDDIISLLTRTIDENDKFLPLTISTLTRKFYFNSSDLRDHYLDHHNIHVGTKEACEKLQKSCEKLMKQYAQFEEGGGKLLK